MPSRRDVFLNNKYYHVFNKTLDGRKLFHNTGISRLFLNLVKYYRSSKADIRYSLFRELPKELKEEREKLLAYQKYFRVELFAYCLMPTHFHFLIKQKREKGIVRFMSDIVNSLTRNYNNLIHRKGPLFIPQFKSRMIVSDEQFIHVSRYIHLNPHSSGIAATTKALIDYPYSSLTEYLDLKEEKMVNVEKILSYFNNDSEDYKKFVLDNAEYQKTLEEVKYIDTERWI